MDVFIVESGRAGWTAAVRAELAQQAAALQTTLDAHVISTPPAPGGEAALLFFHDPAAPVREPVANAAADWRAHGSVVIPVIETAAHAMSLAPALAEQNAFIVDRYAEVEWPSALVDELLSGAFLGRAERRVFVSYRRLDSAGVAGQLADYFANARYDVFLDKIAVAPGLAFQRELFFRLNDADLVVWLASPDIGRSQWVAQELAFAGASHIGILAVVWPDPPDELKATLGVLMDDQKLVLAPGDLVGDPARPGREHQRLSEDALHRIAAHAQRQRARALRGRLANLIPYACASLEKDYEVTPRERIGELDLVERATRETVRVHVLPFRPTLQALYDLHDRAAASGDAPDALGCFYEENDGADRRAAALRFLCEADRPRLSPSRHLLWQFSGKP
jgi:TIR domain